MYIHVSLVERIKDNNKKGKAKNKSMIGSLLGLWASLVCHAQPSERQKSLPPCVGRRLKQSIFSCSLQNCDKCDEWQPGRQPLAPLPPASFPFPFPCHLPPFFWRGAYPDVRIGQCRHREAPEKKSLAFACPTTTAHTAVLITMLLNFTVHNPPGIPHRRGAPDEGERHPHKPHHHHPPHHELQDDHQQEALYRPPCSRPALPAHQSYRK